MPVVHSMLLRGPGGGAGPRTGLVRLVLAAAAVAAVLRPPAAVRAQANCVDNNPSCPGWARIGECQRK